MAHLVNVVANCGYAMAFWRDELFGKGHGSLVI